MKVVYPFVIYLALSASLIFLYVYKVQEKKKYTWIFKNWFYRQSKSSKLSFWFYWLGILSFLFSLINVKGPIMAKDGISKSKNTLILLDLSQSMLAQDILPNRLEKAVFLARHFIKNSKDHNISIHVFSEIQKKLVPFTQDYQLLNSRLRSLVKLNMAKGGSDIYLALKEIFAGLENEIAGNKNLLIITDSEHNQKNSRLISSRRFEHRSCYRR